MLGERSLTEAESTGTKRKEEIDYSHKWKTLGTYEGTSLQSPHLDNRKVSWMWLHENANPECPEISTEYNIWEGLGFPMKQTSFQGLSKSSKNPAQSSTMHYQSETMSKVTKSGRKPFQIHYYLQYQQWSNTADLINSICAEPPSW